jgi:nicotinate-nucleotide adenylyltransferase
LLPSFGDRRHRRIGLLGGSFNPAHAGHLHLTRAALQALRLDQVWWLVSPQNPLKPVKGMAPFVERLAGAHRLAARLGRRAIATGLEARLGVTHTVRTLAALQRRYPRMAFVWLMGADNLGQLPRWWRWPWIFRTRVAVFDRSPYSYRALAGVAPQRFGRARRAPKALWSGAVPAWTYVAMRRHPASGTALRLASREAGRTVKAKTGRR